MVEREQSTHNYHPLASVTSKFAELQKAMVEHAVRTQDARKDRERDRTKADPAKEEKRD